MFTTQTVRTRSVAIAEHIEAPTFSWSGPAECEELPESKRCVRSFTAWDYRSGHHLADTAEPVSSYEMPVQIWLPKDGAGPWPTVVFGHGLSGDRHQAGKLAEVAVPKGIAVVAIDAVEHGEHPAGTDSLALMQVMAFFGIDVQGLALDPLRLRDNWRQSTYDKLQLLQLLATDSDLDGDEKPDAELSKLAYLGVSLGGIMGPELLALTGAFGAAVLEGAGGRVATIIEEAALFEVVIQVMKPPGTGDGEVARFFPVLQTLVEAGDSANYAPHVLENRYEGSGAAPHLLMMSVIDDDTVPPATNRMLARALGIPHVPPVLEEVGVIDVAPAAPVSANLDGWTVGLFQYDRITNAVDEAPEQATHSNVATSREGLLQALSFVETWLETGTPVIVDPYQQLGTPAL